MQKRLVERGLVVMTVLILSFISLPVILNTVSAPLFAGETTIPYDANGHQFKLAVDMGYVEVRAYSASEKSITDAEKNKILELLKPEVERLSSGKQVQLGDSGYTFQLQGGTPLSGVSQGAGLDYHYVGILFAQDAKTNGKTITAKGQ